MLLQLYHDAYPICFTSFHISFVCSINNIASNIVISNNSTIGNSNSTYPTKDEIERFINYMKSYENQDDDIWDSGEIEWEV